MQLAFQQGRKTQMRRVLEIHKDTYGGFEIVENTAITFDANGNELLHECPYGKIGDINNGCLITDIRVEKLQDISEEDAIKEGIEKYGPFGEYKGEPHPRGGSMKFRAYKKAARAFQDIWESIYPNHPTKAWELNPYVWVITFEKVNE